MFSIPEPRLNISNQPAIEISCHLQFIRNLPRIRFTCKVKMTEVINSSRAPEPVGLYAHARRVGDLLFLSGVGPRERGIKAIPGVELNGAGEIVSYGIEEQ